MKSYVVVSSAFFSLYCFLCIQRYWSNRNRASLFICIVLLCTKNIGLIRLLFFPILSSYDFKRLVSLGIGLLFVILFFCAFKDSGSIGVGLLLFSVQFFCTFKSVGLIGLLLFFVLFLCVQERQYSRKRVSSFLCTLFLCI